MGKKQQQHIFVQPRITIREGEEIVFDSPIVQMVPFGNLSLARTDNGAMFVSQNGQEWQRFIFNLIPAWEPEAGNAKEANAEEA